MATREGEVTGWVGWVFFAGIMMIILGMVHALIGFVSIFNDSYLIIAPQNLLFIDITTWAWAHFLLGMVIAFAGFAVFSGQPWARTVGVLMAGMSAIANIAFIPAYPVWSLVVIAMDCLVIYSLTVHGGELKNQQAAY